MELSRSRGRSTTHVDQSSDRPSLGCIQYELVGWRSVTPQLWSTAIRILLDFIDEIQTIESIKWRGHFIHHVTGHHVTGHPSWSCAEQHRDRELQTWNDCPTSEARWVRRDKWREGRPGTRRRNHAEGRAELQNVLVTVMVTNIHFRRAGFIDWTSTARPESAVRPARCKNTTLMARW